MIYHCKTDRTLSDSIEFSYNKLKRGNLKVEYDNNEMLNQEEMTEFLKLRSLTYSVYFIAIISFFGSIISLLVFGDFGLGLMFFMGLIGNILYQLSPKGKRFELLKKRYSKYHANSHAQQRIDLLKQYGIEETSSFIMSDGRQVVFDNKNHLFAILKVNIDFPLSFSHKIDRVHNFSQIVDCELSVDDSVVKKEGIGRAIVGTLVAGGVGAIIGTLTGKNRNLLNSVKVKVIVEDDVNPLMEFVIFNDFKNGLRKDNPKFQKVLLDADNLYSSFKVAMSKGNDSRSVETENISKHISNDLTSKSIREKLLELQDLFNESLITQEEYVEMKKKLLEKI